MDIISHGLWGGAAFGRTTKRDFGIAFFFGIFPDLFSFGIFTVANIIGLSDRPDWSSGPPDPSIIPEYVHRLYDFTHSFVVFLVIFAIVSIIIRKPYWLMWGWGLHIIMDFFTHSLRFFPTPIFWPISEFRFDGIPWSHPIIFFPNVVLLLLVYLILIFRRR